MQVFANSSLTIDLAARTKLISSHPNVEKRGYLTISQAGKKISGQSNRKTEATCGTAGKPSLNVIRNQVFLLVKRRTITTTNTAITDTIKPKYSIRTSGEADTMMVVEVAVIRSVFVNIVVGVVAGGRAVVGWVPGDVIVYVVGVVGAGDGVGVVVVSVGVVVGLVGVMILVVGSSARSTIALIM